MSKVDVCDLCSGRQVFGRPSTQACEITGVDFRQLDHWARVGVLRPSLRDASGSGTTRRYSYLDLVALKAIKNLRGAGVSLVAMREAIDCLSSYIGENLATASLVIDGARSFLTQNGDDLYFIRQGQDVLIIVPLGPIVSQIDSEITRLHQAARC